MGCICSFVPGTYRGISIELQLSVQKTATTLCGSEAEQEPCSWSQRMETHTALQQQPPAICALKQRTPAAQWGCTGLPALAMSSTRTVCHTNGIETLRKGCPQRHGWGLVLPGSAGADIAEAGEHSLLNLLSMTGAAAGLCRVPISHTAFTVQLWILSEYF